MEQQEQYFRGMEDTIARQWAENRRLKGTELLDKESLAQHVEELTDELERLRAENEELRKFRDGLVGDYVKDGRVVYKRGE
ncbi:MAG: hypothetical protein R6U98_02620 [Pirellulaceae bacterium]